MRNLELDLTYSHQKHCRNNNWSVHITKNVKRENGTPALAVPYYPPPTQTAAPLPAATPHPSTQTAAPSHTTTHHPSQETAPPTSLPTTDHHPSHETAPPTSLPTTDSHLSRALNVSVDPPTYTYCSTPVALVLPSPPQSTSTQQSIHRRSSVAGQALGATTWEAWHRHSHRHRHG
ncbi:hypothetical protein Sjap_018198 [Stephania japonica]|uniref:Uncharacterized protein n=1 Tax=Stephania japonica TaxID=461633 RepID=A0AAP0NK98_9MAGN